MAQLHTDNQRSSWREAVGLMDSLIETHMPSASGVTVNRYGSSVTCDRYDFELQDPGDGAHEAFSVTTTQIGVQKFGYDNTTEKINEISYHPAYTYRQIAAGLIIASIAVARNIELVIPTVVYRFKPITADEVITDIRNYMTQAD